MLIARVSGAEPVNFEKEISPLLSEHCIECHGGVRRKAGLSYLSRTDATTVLQSGKRALVPGVVAESELIRRVESGDPDESMPPGAPLPAGARELLRRWIAEGATWPEHWSRRSLGEVSPPEIPASLSNGADHPIDRFVLEDLGRAGITPSPSADRATLIRRLSLDLLGLPPSRGEVERFVNDTVPDAYDRLVDQLLASPHFGERWGRHWLDRARYADSDGYEKDSPRPDAWRWRDWVIQSINEDLPFDEFTVRQVAGDLLPGNDPSIRLATAFHVQTLFNREGGVDPEEDRTKRVIDRVNTMGQVWLGLTVGCAQCHDHPYDPVRHEEYYRLVAFFNNAEETEADTPNWPGALEERARRERELRARESARAEAWEHWLGALETAGEESRQEFPKEVQAAAARAPEEREEADLRRLRDYYFVEVDAECAPLHREFAEFTRKNIVRARVIAERSSDSRPTHVLHRGDFLQPDIDRGPVAPGTPGCLPALVSRGDRPDRLDLARWLVNPENPLTPRAVVNDVWSHLFGVGLSPTAEDFGSRGEAPSHPALLDWLARHWSRELKWSRKALIRVIVTSATYRQSSDHRPELAETDPDNRRLYRQNRFRVEAELVRDLPLAVSGLLSHKIGGPSVFPPMPADVAALSYADNFKWQTSEGEDRYRRGMYTFFKRTAPHPNLTTFDCPDANVSLAVRNRSNTPLQALTVLNNEVFVECARALGRQVLDQAFETDADRVKHLFELCLARSATPREVQILGGLLTAARQYYLDDPEAARRLLAVEGAAATADETIEEAAWMATVRIVLNLDEFLTRS